jgi:hypothetical protein
MESKIQLLIIACMKYSGCAKISVFGPRMCLSTRTLALSLIEGTRKSEGILVYFENEGEPNAFTTGNVG